MNNVYLIGMMGSGKSVTGKRLAALLHYGFVDLDERIQEKTRRSIVDLFEKEGEAYFRDQEEAVLRECSAVPGRVIATGGGTVLRDGNIARMRQTGKMIYLESSLETLWQRVRQKKDRPLLKQRDPREALSAILESRKSIYEGVCDFKVTSEGDPEEVAKKIFESLGSP